MIGILVPPRCLVCGELDEEPLCETCISRESRLRIGSCPKCGIGDVGECEECEWMGSLDWFRALARYDGVAGRAIRQLKFSRCIELAEPIGRRMRSLMEDVPEFDLVSPVPIHWSREAVRGFNQAELLAARMGLISTPLLDRIRPTKPQTRVSGKERLTNLQKALRARREAFGIRVLLIDDVVTSGSTLEACASALKSAGASWVGGITYAKG